MHETNFEKKKICDIQSKTPKAKTRNKECGLQLETPKRTLKK